MLAFLGPQDRKSVYSTLVRLIDLESFHLLHKTYGPVADPETSERGGGKKHEI